MCEHTQQQGNGDRPEGQAEQSDLRWVARWMGLLVTVMGIVTVAISCQERRANAPHASATASVDSTVPAGTEGGEGATTAPATAGLPDAKALGFSYPAAPPNPGRPADEVAKQNATCVACHTASDAHTMHVTDIAVTCVDCHGGNWNVPIPDDFTANV